MIKMTDLKYTVRLMTKDDVPGVLKVWGQTGNQRSSHSMYTWLEVDKEAFNIAVTDSGEVIAACSAVLQHSDLAFVGTYCCLEKCRGHGVGKKVWNACMEHIGARNAALNAVSVQLDLYRDKGGFPIAETRWTHLISETKDPVNHEALSDQVTEGVIIEPFQDAFLPVMFEYDIALVGYDRKRALELNCKEVDSKTLVAFKDGKCVGFGTIKISCRKCGQVGPLYADDAVVAEVILKRLIVSLPEVKGFIMMTMSTNRSANDFIKKIGCLTTNNCCRLYRREKIEVDTKKIFAQWDVSFTPY